MGNYIKYRLVRINIEDEKFKHRLVSIGFREGEELIYKGEAGGNVVRVCVCDIDVALSADIFRLFELEEI